MQIETDDQTGKMVRAERRGIWLALVVVLVLAATLLFGSDTRRALLTGMAVAMVFGVTWSSRRRLDGARRDVREGREAMMHDELRQLAISRAYKWAFFVILGALATYNVVGTIVSIDLTGQMVAALAVALGVFTFLATFLLIDRS